jgi:hypothetical protein
MLLDRLGPRSGCWPHDGEVAGGAGFLCSDIPVRGDDGARAIGANDDAAAVEEMSAAAAGRESVRCSSETSVADVAEAGRCA